MEQLPVLGRGEARRLGGEGESVGFVDAVLVALPGSGEFGGGEGVGAFEGDAELGFAFAEGAAEQDVVPLADGEAGGGGAEAHIGAGLDRGGAEGGGAVRGNGEGARFSDGGDVFLGFACSDGDAKADENEYEKPRHPAKKIVGWAGAIQKLGLGGK